MVNIRGLDKADVLRVLYNNARVQGMGFLQALPGDMSKEDAQELVKDRHNPYFDYLHGRVMKVDLSSDEEFDPRLYDRDNGSGAAERAIGSLR